LTGFSQTKTLFHIAVYNIFIRFGTREGLVDKMDTCHIPI